MSLLPNECNICGQRYCEHQKIPKMESNEPPKEDKQLISKIDELLGQLKTISQSVFELREHASLVLPDVTPVDTKEEVEYVECVIDENCKYLTFGYIYPVLETDEHGYKVEISKGVEVHRLKGRFKPSTREAYLSQQEQPIIKEEVKERWRVSVEPFAEHRDDVKIVISLNDGFISDGGGHHLATQIKALLATI